MPWVPIHERDDVVRPDYEVIDVEFDNEPAVLVLFKTPFVFGNTTPYSDGKLYASQRLRKNYDRMRVVELSFENERVQSLTYAYRKAGK